jgi:glutamine synthetase
MSELMRHYIGGQLALMPEVMAMICPTINSYKRTVPGTWAAINASWGVENRTTALRAIPSGAKSTRVEYRLAGADGNPYLTMAAALASGLYGVENKMEPAAPVSGSAYDGKLTPLPRTLEESTARMKSSKVVRALLGDVFVDHFTATREWEVRQAQAAVTSWELERYFEII